MMNSNLRSDREIDWGNTELPIVPHSIFQVMEEGEKKRVGVVERLWQVMKPIVIGDWCRDSSH
jgi:hypothetical protein